MNNLTFDNRFINHLPADSETENYCRSVENAAYSFVNAAKTSNPTLIAVTPLFAKQLGFSEHDIKDAEFTRVMTGNQLLPGMKSYAQCYGGHQFGQWAGQLGDGRAINLGELTTAGLGHQTLQLKGAGKTPYSRRADGMAVLRSSIREFLCSEAMFHLGIPTTRALSLCLSGEEVVRDKMYDGNAAIEPCAVVCRVSSSFLRFGSFQLPASRGEEVLLIKLVKHSIKSDFAHLLSGSSEFSKEIYLAWFSEISQKTCAMIVHWMRVGFVHGVMNTDNMSILGETIDYGPYGWVDDFDLNWTPNTTDAHEKRYRFGGQAEIGQWNLFQLANAIFPLIGEAEPLQAVMSDFALNYQNSWCTMMASKLGFKDYQGQTDLYLFQSLEKLLSTVETDMTIFYRLLATLPNDLDTDSHQQWLTLLAPCFYNAHDLEQSYLQDFTSWFKRYLARLNYDGLTQRQRAQAMNQVNPKFVLRNYLAQQAIELAEQGDYSEIHQLQLILQSPYKEQPEFQDYAKKRPDWARNKAGCSMLSCSS
ncbi:protein adenylyltransferase SelO [Psychromonas ossibalaenae]|uniref:protein adenylyltransferase SelO n=1 Tax=Psychromonas ossibalaenae TaxID=444922 RepID=UPI00037819C4|nr:YdiU family protein [Psychromonas ossibalaenae]